MRSGTSGILTGVALGICLLGSTSCRDSQDMPDNYTVSASVFEDWIPLVGSLEAANPITFRAERNGLSKLIYLIEDGTPVEAGDVVARFDQSELEERIRNLTRDRDIADATLTALVDAEHPLEVQRLQQDLLTAEADLIKETSLREETQALVEEDLLAPEELQVHDQTLLQLKSRVGALKQQLELTRNILHPAKQKTAKARLDAAEAGLKDAQQELEATIVTAPSAGTVHHPLIPIDGERRPARVGDGLFRNQVYAQLSDLTQLVIRSEIGERMVSKVAPGMNARVRLPSMPNLQGDARVAEVGAYPRGGNRRYPVELHWIDPPTSLRPGLTAMIEVLSSREENALVVPFEYLVRKEGKVFVKTRTGLAEVTLQSANAQGARVVSGLEADTEVLRP